MFKAPKNTKVGIIGLGYVGLPLAVAFSKHYEVIGFDIKETRVAELIGGKDGTLEVSEAVLKEALCRTGGLILSSSLDAIMSCNFYIVTVPTPVDKQKSPDLSALRQVSEMIGGVLKDGDIVVYESTVYPGATEEECVPTLAAYSKLTYNKDFYVGYSPERINPGDKQHNVIQIKKVTSGSTPEAAKYIDGVYAKVIKAGTHLAPSIQVAEASKVIENAQRDVNIAFVNELSKIFNRLGIDTHEVLAAASTKWNFLSFRPGLVGGHCIGVDPYYLAQRAQKMGYHPEVILSGRKINDGMGEYVAHEVVKLMARQDIAIKGAKVLLLGFTFKENCPDIRNTKVFDVKETLEEYGLKVDVYDPWASKEEVKTMYNFDLLNGLSSGGTFDALVLAVGHEIFRELDWAPLLSENRVIFDVKGMLDKKLITARL